MRDPNRLYEFYAELQRIHIEHFPDWRFGQFMINFLGAADRDPFFWEEDECLERLRKFAGENNELPCKVGDVVYFISQICNGKKSRLEISRRTITQIGGNKLNRIWFISDEPYEITFFPSEFGKNVFLTKEEAEKALSDKE